MSEDFDHYGQGIEQELMGMGEGDESDMYDDWLYEQENNQPTNQTEEK